MSARLDAVKKVGKTQGTSTAREPLKQSYVFGSRAFGRRQIEQSLPKKPAQNWLAAMDGKEQIERDYLDLFAETLKEWAIRHGATHFTHWFQPLTGAGAEKHDSFLIWRGAEGVIEHLRGKDLLQAEPDASSFPSGGLRCTAEARGYTVWDPSTPPFLWESAEGLTLCIPSLFFSWKGQALDYKIPLLRADQKLEKAALRLLKLAGLAGQRVFSTLGPEQEYFTVDRSLYLLRPDLALAGRTVYGARPAKGQELEDHYFSALDERALAFMRDFEEAAVLLGVPLKTRHNEVAPAQHEAAPLFEKASLAADHNLMLMELMRKVAPRHDLSCLFHEKPFASVNGSGKHCNWSLATDQGVNLLDPKKDHFAFLTLLTAILRAVHEHAALLRSSIASAGNDWRLGGSEAPPTILSVFLGEALEGTLQKLIHGQEGEETRRAIDLGLSHILPHQADPADRNRTSFFAFTDNKFEFRAVGASQHPAWPVAVLNAIVADSLALLLDEIEGVYAGGDLLSAALPVLRKHLRAAEPVIFSGNGYSAAWEEEAMRRGLPNVRKSFHAFAALRDPRTERVFEGILSADELQSRFEIAVETYAKQMNIECNLMVELFRTQILPAALETEKRWASAVGKIRELGIDVERQIKPLRHLAERIGHAIEAVDAIEQIQKQMGGMGWEAKAKIFCELALPRMETARAEVDELERLCDNEYWPLPKYRELLYVK